MAQFLKGIEGLSEYTVVSVWSDIVGSTNLLYHSFWFSWTSKSVENFYVIKLLNANWPIFYRFSPRHIPPTNGIEHTVPGLRPAASFAVHGPADDGLVRVHDAADAIRNAKSVLSGIRSVSWSVQVKKSFISLEWTKDI